MRSRPATDAYRDGWERVFDRGQLYSKPWRAMELPCGHQIADLAEDENAERYCTKCGDIPLLECGHTWQWEGPDGCDACALGMARRCSCRES